MRHAILVPASLCAAMFLAAPQASALGFVVPWYANPVATNAELRIERTSCLAEDSAPVSNAWETAKGSAALAGRAPVAKRLSHSDDFRPRLNVLLDDGAVAVFTLTEALDAVKWTTVVSNSVLAAAAGVPAGSVASDLQVQDDGAFAFLKYGTEWRSLGYDPPRWSLFVLDANGDPPADAASAQAIWKSTYQTDPAQILGSAYITDGKWKFECHRNSSGQITVGNNTATDANHIIGNLNGHSAEYLDLSRGTAVPGDARYASLDNVSELQIRGNYKGAFADRMRVYLGTRNQSFWYNSRGNWSGVEEAVEGSALPTSMSYVSSISSSVRRYAVSLPNLLAVASNGRFSTTGATETDFGDWDFSSLTNLEVRTFSYAGGSGVLSFPSLVSSRDNTSANYTDGPLYACSAEEIRLSAEKRTLEKLGSRTLRNMTNLKKLVIGGRAGGFAFSQGGVASTMFVGSAKLVDVVFTGGHPVFSDPDKKVSDGQSSDSKARNIVFAHPPLDDPVYGAEWTTFLAGKTITPLSRAERIAFKAANPGRPVPYGLAGTDVFLTTYPQYIALLGSEDEELGAPEPSVEWDPAYGTVAVSGAQELEPGSGVFPEGSVLTLTATGANGGSFRKWYGDIGENNPTSPVIRVPAATGAWIHARFVHPWEITDYDRTHGTAKATDGNFTIHLTEMNAVTHTFTLGRKERMGLYDVEIADGGATTNMQLGASTVDLGGAFLLDGDDTPWTATAFADARSGATYPGRYDGRIGTFFSPGTIRRRLWDVFRPDNQKANGVTVLLRTAYPRVFLDEPFLPDYLSDYAFSGTVVTQIVLQVPSLGGFKQTVLWDGKMAGDFAWWDLSSVSNFDERAWCTQYIQNNNRSYLDSLRAYDMRGALRLPSLRSVKCSPALGAMLSPMPYLQSLELGGGRATVTNLDARALAGNSSLTNLVINADPDLVVGEGIFDDHAGRKNSVDLVYPGHVPERMEFTGAAPNNDVFANLLERVGPKDRPVLVFVRRFDQTWKNAPYLAAPTRAEARLYDGDPDFVFGVYRGSLFGFDYPKALFVQRNFKRTTVLIVR